jgi:hypothetical protein
MHHLTSICGLSTKNAKNEIKYFKMKMKNIFWEKIVEIIVFSWNRGCDLHVLGHAREYNFYPAICLILGDGPAQREVCGIYGGLSKRSCTLCYANILKDQIYRENEIGLRNVNNLEDLCIEAEELQRNMGNTTNAKESKQLQLRYR